MCDIIKPDGNNNEKPLDIMASISNGNVPTLDITEIKSQLNAFLLAQAQNALQTNVKLTKTLDMLQEKYGEKLIEYIKENDDETAIVYLPQMIDTIAKSLDRSSAVISDVLNNKEILNLTLIDNSDKSINISNNAETRSAIQDPVSRAKIREAVEKMIDFIESEKEEIVEIDENNENNT